MKVVFLQHAPVLPPGLLLDYLRQSTLLDATVLSTNEIRYGQAALSNVDLVVSLGSSTSVYSETEEWVAHERQILSTLIDSGTAILGICFGAQMIASIAGGSVKAIGRSYAGWFDNDATRVASLAGKWFRYHREQCVLSNRCELLAASGGIVQAFRYKNAIGLQFHPEVNATIAGDLIRLMPEALALDSAEGVALAQETEQNNLLLSAARKQLFNDLLMQLGLAQHLLTSPSDPLAR